MKLLKLLLFFKLFLYIIMSRLQQRGPPQLLLDAVLEQGIFKKSRPTNMTRKGSNKSNVGLGVALCKAWQQDVPLERGLLKRSKKMSKTPNSAASSKIDRKAPRRPRVYKTITMKNSTNKSMRYPHYIPQRLTDEEFLQKAHASFERYINDLKSSYVQLGSSNASVATTTPNGKRNSDAPTPPTPEPSVAEFVLRPQTSLAGAQLTTTTPVAGERATILFDEPRVLRTARIAPRRRCSPLSSSVIMWRNIQKPRKGQVLTLHIPTTTITTVYRSNMEIDDGDDGDEDDKGKDVISITLPSRHLLNIRKAK